MKRNTFFMSAALLMVMAALGLNLHGALTDELIGWRDLGVFLDEISGWEPKGELKGSTTSMGGFSISQVSRSFTNDDQSIDIEIIDSGLNQMVFAGIKMAMNMEVDSSDEYIKKITIKNFPGMEKYEYDSQDGEVNLMIADRFLVKIEGDDLEDCSSLKAVAEKLDLEGLSNLAKK